jgi:putative sigma-54 modulation protein
MPTIAVRYRIVGIPARLTLRLRFEANVQVKLSVRHGHLSEEHQLRITQKAEKLLHFFDRLIMIEVMVDLSGPDKHVEVIAEAEHKHEFVGHGHDPDVLVSARSAIEKVTQQIKHYKDTIQDHRRAPSHGGTEGGKD